VNRLPFGYGLRARTRLWNSSLPTAAIKNPTILSCRLCKLEATNLSHGMLLELTLRSLVRVR
jgi:hypothetical protein